VKGGVVRFISVANPNQTSGCSIKEDGSFFVEDAPIGETRVTIDTESIGPELGSRYVKLPAKYLKPETSGLTITVLAGENTSDFALQ
jgi:hypothetical protein